MPPAFPAAKESTMMPKKSSRRRTPAPAPLSAKTNVPSRSSACKLSFAEPGERADHQRLDAGLEGRMQHRREERTVVARQLVHLARGLGLGVFAGIGAADEPEHRGH